MITTLLQPYELMGVIYGGFVIGIVYSVLELLPFEQHKILRAISDTMFYLFAMAITGVALIITVNGKLQVHLIIALAVSAYVFINTTGLILKHMLRR